MIRVAFNLFLLPLAVFALSSVNKTSQRPIPITVLSGFLGSGKTTLLQNMLQNKEGLRVAVIVNDVASVNIDSKLVARESTGANPTGGSDGMVELQNGCACCSLSDELLTSVSELVTMSDLRGDDQGFHHIVVELSGVADPKAVRSKFQDAIFSDMPLMERVVLDTLVTLVDSSMFKEHFESTKKASRKETPELFFRPGEKPKNEIPDDMKAELPPKLLEAVMAGLNAADERADGDNSVTDLLVSQAETADIVVLNKVDLVDDSETEQLREILAAMNPRAKIVTTSFGKLAISSVLGVAGGKGVVQAGVVDDHRDYVNAAAGGLKKDNSIQVESSHSHSHEHGTVCTDEDCSDPSHSHSSHSHQHDQGVDCTDKDFTDPTNPHSHSHDHSSETACNDPNCSDSTHSHDHHNHGEECNDAECNDPSHSHSHMHSSHAGIGSFVYKARRPFHPGRLVSFLRNLPVVRGVPPTPEDGASSLEVSVDASAALRSTLRSKGFVWCADSHVSAMYWSHAGKSFEYTCLGQWWATLPREEWPADAVSYVLADFDDVNHEDANNPEDTVGDRRQEVVFIGPKFGDQSQQGLICDALDKCLLGDEEWHDYKSIQNDEEKLQARFANAIETKMMSY